ncbi:LysE family translocator [Paludibacterium purpuratum]|uniref:Threonine/homoserine/homoserine lactone efflux protein n=1 Tax=Paludibacterium purpuratum TaxID=1144873 RepID=A0A4R7B9K4_9NEIS|nr:LysE family translocator [Paludibacterium purpuratum]TDR81564.1 threonine/homoserine/homoserine lactone efflux protein [Paludibacterium purpuratum]
MSEYANLWLYFLLVFGVIILPGMDMAFVMSSSMTGGRRVGLVAVAGIVAGGICHMLIAATGLSVLLKLVPATFLILLFAGAIYIAWIGWSLLHTRSLASSVATRGARTARQGFFGAMATCLLNPKAYLFMLAIFPQFVRADRGPIWMQASVLSLITAATQVAVYGSLALLAAQAMKTLADKPKAGAYAARGVGLMLILASVVTVWSGIRSL